MFKNFLSSYFLFTKKERTGIMVILFLILLFAFLPKLYPYFFKPKQYDHSQFEKEIAALQMMESDSAEGGQKDYQKRYPTYKNENDYDERKSSFEGSLFEFDPNTLSPEGWKKLGLRDKTIATIGNYLSKGGRFRKPEDIGKIWGLHEDEVQRLMPYVKIAGSSEQDHSFYQNNDRPVYEKKEYHKEPKIIDVNTADSTALIGLPGIGAGYARRIINFRNKLGGFYSVQQVAETFGLPDSTFQQIKPLLNIGNASVQQLNINTATVDELKNHPYIRYALANAIIQYRTQHGNFSSVEGIKKIMMVTGEIFNKLSPYLKTN